MPYSLARTLSLASATAFAALLAGCGAGSFDRVAPRRRTRCRRDRRSHPGAPPTAVSSPWSEPHCSSTPRTLPATAVPPPPLLSTHKPHLDQ